MSLRNKILFFGWVTLLVFPIPGFLIRYILDDISWVDFLEPQNIQVMPIGLGLEFGFVYGFIAFLLMQAPFFDSVPMKIDKMVGEMNLKFHHVQELVKNSFFVQECNLI